MKQYRVKYTLEKVVEVLANNPQEAVEKAADLEDFNYEFYNDSFEARELENKTITQAIYSREYGLTSLTKKVVKDLPKEDRAFERVEEIKILQSEEDYIEVRLYTYDMNSLEILGFIEQLCRNKLRIV